MPTNHDEPSYLAFARENVRAKIPTGHASVALLIERIDRADKLNEELRQDNARADRQVQEMESAIQALQRQLTESSRVNARHAARIEELEAEAARDRATYSDSLGKHIRHNNELSQQITELRNAVTTPQRSPIDDDPRFWSLLGRFTEACTDNDFEAQVMTLRELRKEYNVPVDRLGQLTTWSDDFLAIALTMGDTRDTEPEAAKPHKKTCKHCKEEIMWSVDKGKWHDHNFSPAICVASPTSTHIPAPEPAGSNWEKCTGCGALMTHTPHCPTKPY